MLLIVAACATAPANPADARSQIDVTVAGTPAAVRTRVQSAFADAQFPTEPGDGSVLAASVPLQQQDMGGRAGTRVVVQSALIPVGSDSTRVVLTGRILAPAAMGLAAETIPVTSGSHSTYGKTNRQGWAALERIAAALR